MRFIERLGDLAGKNVVVFCTYKLAIGSTLRQMAKALEEEGARVVEQFKYRGSEPNSEFASFAKSLNQLANMPVPDGFQLKERLMDA